MTPENAELLKNTVDALSLVTVVATLVQILPAFAALFTIIWTGLRIWETETVRDWTNRSRRVRNKRAVPDEQ